MKTIPKILILSFLLVFYSCGTRKAAIDKLKVAVISKEAEIVNLVEKENSIVESTDKTVIINKVDNDISQKEQKTEVKETFVDGKLTERTTITTLSDKVDKSKSDHKLDNSSQQNAVKDVLKHLEKTANKVVDSLFQTKAKKADANTTIVKNVGGWVVLVIIVVIIIGSIWYWIKKK